MSEFSSSSSLSNNDPSLSDPICVWATSSAEDSSCVFCSRLVLFSSLPIRILCLLQTLKSYLSSSEPPSSWNSSAYYPIAPCLASLHSFEPSPCWVSWRFLTSRRFASSFSHSSAYSPPFPCSVSWRCWPSPPIVSFSSLRRIAPMEVSYLDPEKELGLKELKRTNHNDRFVEAEIIEWDCILSLSIKLRYSNYQIL